jgi:hypothetical protein
MTVAKYLAYVIYPVAMAGAVGLSLSVLIGLLHVGMPEGYPIAEPPRATTPKPVLAPAITPESPPAPAITPVRKPIDPGISGVPGDHSPFVGQMQGALIKKGYSVGPAGADSHFNDDTLAALEAFQDDKALPVQPTCDQQCWTALGLPDSK